MFMKNDKKKSRPLLAIGVGALAVYGAYSMVAGAKNICCEKAKMLTNVFKKREKCEEMTDCTDDECGF